jgi:hypothetical protein
VDELRVVNSDGHGLKKRTSDGRTGQSADIEKSPIYLFSFYNLPSDRKFR